AHRAAYVVAASRRRRKLGVRYRYAPALSADSGMLFSQTLVRPVEAEDLQPVDSRNRACGELPRALDGRCAEKNRDVHQTAPPGRGTDALRGVERMLH